MTAFCSPVVPGTPPLAETPRRVGGRTRCNVGVTLVNVLTAAGLAAPNPRDVTDQRCPDIHCAGAVATDTVSILIFGRSRDAQLYEASLSNGYQIGDVVLEFAPTIDAAQRTAYERIVARAVG